MHLHTSRLDVAEPLEICPGDQRVIFPAVDPKAPADPKALITCERPLRSPLTAQQVLTRTLEQMRRHSVRRAVVAGRPEQLKAWVEAAPERVIPATGYTPDRAPTLDDLRCLHREGRVAVFTEIGPQYGGRSLSDPQLEEFWALAEELDVPVGVHLGLGSPDAPRSGGGAYRAGLTSPLQLEPVLARHPNLRIYVMHYASPLVDEMIAMLFTYGNLYVDISANNWNLPRAAFYNDLRQLIDAGMEERILFGTDQGPFPDAVGKAIEAVEAAPFLSEAQKRAIFYDNAARFLRLTPEQIAADHAPAARPN
jgi:uncharacterized protein